MGNKIVLAASNSSESDQKRADFVASGKHDESLINQSIARLPGGGTLQLLDGDYYIDSFAEEDHTAIHFGYNDGNARAVNFCGDTENKSYNTRFGVSVHVTQAALESLPPGMTGRVFGGTSRKPDAPGAFFTYTFVNNVNFTNFYLFLADASRPVVGLDCRHFGSSYIQQVGIFTEQYFNDRFLHRKPQTPAVGCIGICTCSGSNDEMARIGCSTVDVGGLHTGIYFNHTDHMILSQCSACRCCYGYWFHGTPKTITMINCADEGNTHLPHFCGSSQITSIDFNIERFNADFIPDDPEGNSEHGATEEKPGHWRGFISYTLQGKAFDLKSFWASGHGHNIRTVNLSHPRDVRPENPEFLTTFFDRSTNRTLTWNGSNWVDAMGNPVHFEDDVHKNEIIK